MGLNLEYLRLDGSNAMTNGLDMDDNDLINPSSVYTVTIPLVLAATAPGAANDIYLDAHDASGVTRTRIHIDGDAGTKLYDLAGNLRMTVNTTSIDIPTDVYMGVDKAMRLYNSGTLNDLNWQNDSDTGLRWIAADQFGLFAGDVELLRVIEGADDYVALYGTGVVLPLKGTTGDPTVVEGKLYVNTFDNSVRVYADGAWRDLATW